MTEALFTEQESMTPQQYTDLQRQRVKEAYIALLLEEKPIRSVNAAEVGVGAAASAAKHYANKDILRFFKAMRMVGIGFPEVVRDFETGGNIPSRVETRMQLVELYEAARAVQDCDSIVSDAETDLVSRLEKALESSLELLQRVYGKSYPEIKEGTTWP